MWGKSEVRGNFQEDLLGITFEYTPRHTPQHNGVVERKFQTLYVRVRAMINGSGICFIFLST